MLHGLFIFLALSASVIYLHKLGHYLTGRWLVGIPAVDITIVLTSLPQYVGIRDGNGWASPTAFPNYLTAYAEYDPELAHISPYLAAGELTQTAGVVAISGLAAVGGVPIVAQSVILASIMLTGYHLISDFGLNLHMGHPTGDFSALWAHSPRTAVAVVLLVVVPHGILYSVFL